MNDFWGFSALWCLGILASAVITDYRYHRITNRTVIIGLVGGLFLNLADPLPALAGAGFPLVLLLFFAMGLMGAGDIKLLCAIGATVRYPDILPVILYSFVFCGIHLIVRAIRQKRFGAMLREIWLDLWCSFLARQSEISRDREKRLPMAGSIAAATILIWLRRIIPF